MLTIAYDGTDFCGWQKQHATATTPESLNLPPEVPFGDADAAHGDARPELRTVQAIVERAVRETVREPVELIGASRTDSGVHAAAQCAAFTTTATRRGPADDRLCLAINARLPDDVAVTSCRPVHPRFDPIGHCEAKGYRYLVHTGPDKPLWNRRFVHHCHAAIDDDAVRAAAGLFVGTLDFAAFAAAGHGRRSTVRTVFGCDAARLDPHTLAIDISGDGFLYNMVRIVAGTLLQVGRGRMTPADVTEALASRDRRRAGPTLPPQGLRLEWTRYPAAAFNPHPGPEDDLRPPRHTRPDSDDVRTSDNIDQE